MTTKLLTKPEEMQAEEKVENECVHYWVIDPPNGPTSNGVCKICGAEKEFKNYVFYSPWDAESSPLSGVGIGFDSDSDGEDEGEFIFVKERKRSASW